MVSTHQRLDRNATRRPAHSDRQDRVAGKLSARRDGVEAGDPDLGRLAFDIGENGYSAPSCKARKPVARGIERSDAGLRLRRWRQNGFGNGEPRRCQKHQRGHHKAWQHGGFPYR